MENKKWVTDGLNSRQIKRLNTLFSNINWEKKTYVSLSRSFDGEKFSETKTTFTSPFEAGRSDVDEKLRLLKDQYQATITPTNIQEIEEKLTDLLKWAEETRPIRDERRSEEELIEAHNRYLQARANERKREEEFRAKSVQIPKGKRGVMLDICFDNSDIRTDYFEPHYKLESYLLAILPAGREDEKSLRSVINRIPALKEIQFKWYTEKYSGGHGNYLSSEPLPEKRQHPYDKDRTIRCHYEITYRTGYTETRAIPHPTFYLGEIGQDNGNGATEVSISEMTIRENTERNGVEIVFPSKPHKEVIDTLKEYGFRWSFKQGLWWKRNSPGLVESIKKALEGLKATDSQPTQKQ